MEFPRARRSSEFAHIPGLDDSYPVRLSAGEAAPLGLHPGEWESAGFHVAAQEDGCYLWAPTTADSTASGIPLQYHTVTARTTTPSVYFISEASS